MSSNPLTFKCCCCDCLSIPAVAVGRTSRLLGLLLPSHLRLLLSDCLHQLLLLSDITHFLSQRYMRVQHVAITIGHKCTVTKVELHKKECGMCSVSRKLCCTTRNVGSVYSLAIVDRSCESTPKRNTTMVRSG